MNSKAAWAKRPCHVWWLAVLVVSVSSARGDVGRGRHGMVVTVHPMASDVGVRVMRDGGNAFDAAVAAGFMLGVVDSSNSGIGGGCFVVYRLADGTIGC